MTIIHRYTYFWKIAGTASGFGLSIMLLLPLLVVAKDAAFYSTFVWLSIIIFVVSLLYTFEVFTGKIITSPSGIEWFSIGIHAQIPWDMIERIDSNGFGYLFLIFSKPIYTKKPSKKILHWLGSDKRIELAGYISNPATSTLLSEIMKYAPQIKNDSLGS